MMAQAGRVLQQATAPHGGVDVEQVVERELLALALGQVPHAARLLGDVERGALARVLAVAERLDPLHRDDRCRRGSPSSLRRQVAGDGRVVVGGVGEHLGRELAPHLGA